MSGTKLLHLDDDPACLATIAQSVFGRFELALLAISSAVSELVCQDSISVWFAVWLITVVLIN